MTILDFTPAAPVMRGLTAVQLNDDLWRVTRASGEVAGYIERLEGSSKFRAKRMLVQQRRFVAVGEFWRFGDALEIFAMG